MASKNKTFNAQRQELFCTEFLVDLNATQAAARAGYSPKTAAEQASRLLRKVNIRARIAELMDERSKRTLVDSDFVVRNLIDIAMKCQNKVPVMVYNPVDRRMEQKKDDDDKHVWEFDSAGANKALESLGRHLGMFTDKTRVSQFVEQPLFGPL